MSRTRAMNCGEMRRHAPYMKGRRKADAIFGEHCRKNTRECGCVSESGFHSHRFDLGFCG